MYSIFKKMRNKLIILALSATLSLSLTGCSMNSSGTSSGQIIKSADESVQITLPDGWKGIKAPVGDIIKATNYSNAEIRVVVNVNLEESLVDIKPPYASYSNVKYDTTTIDSKSAQLIEYTDNDNVHYLIGEVKKGDLAYHIFTSCEESSFAANKEQFLKMIESFKVLKENMAFGKIYELPDSTEVNGKKVMTSTDGTLQITIPGEWKVSKLSTNTLMEATDLRGRLSVGALPRSKTKPGLTLEDLEGLYEEANNSGAMNLIDLKQVTIHSEPALLTEYSKVNELGEEHYLSATIIVNGAVYEIKTSSSESDFSNYKDEFLNIIQSFKILHQPESK